MDANSAYEFIRSRFVPLKDTRALIKKHNLKIKYGNFSEAEAATVKKILTQFLKDRRLKIKDLKKYLIEEAEFPIHDLLYECTNACELRTYKSVHTHIMYMYNPFIYDTIFSQDKDLQLLDLVNQKGFKWKEISYHLSKFKDLCLRRYRKLKGETIKKLGKMWINHLVENMPATEEEWNVLCEEVKLSKAQILNAIEKHLNGKQLQLPKCHLKEIELCLRILNCNHYCRFNININNVIHFLTGDALSIGIFEKIDGDSTPFFSSRGKSNRKNTAEIEAADEVGSNDSFEEMVENITNSQNKNPSQTRFLEKFLDFFRLDPSFNLNVVIDKDDIFWFNITRDMVIQKSEAYYKYNLLSRRYDWKIFQDIYDTVMKLSYDYLMLKTKESLLDNKQLNVKTEPVNKCEVSAVDSLANDNVENKKRP